MSTTNPEEIQKFLFDLTVHRKDEEIDILRHRITKLESEVRIYRDNALRTITQRVNEALEEVITHLEDLKETLI